MPGPNLGQVNTSTKEGVNGFMLAKLQTQQSTNLTGGTDHVKFDTVVASRGSDISLDTTDAYSSAQGAAALGRFTLKAGKSYRLTGSVAYILASGATGLLEYSWFDATNNVEMPSTRGLLMVATTATHETGGSDAEAVFTPAQDTLVELRFTVATALSQIGTTGARSVVAYIETL